MRSHFRALKDLGTGAHGVVACCVVALVWSVVVVDEKNEAGLLQKEAVVGTKTKVMMALCACSSSPCVGFDNKQRL